MHNSQKKLKETHSFKKQPNSSEIDSLYNQFESLKSQIYGVRRDKQPPINRQWSSKAEKSKAVEMLRESTIVKCQQELQESMRAIQEGKKKEGFKKGKIPQQNLRFSVLQSKQANEPSKSLTKRFKEYEEEQSEHFQDIGKISGEKEQLREGLHMFSQFLRSSEKTRVVALSESRRTQNSQISSLLGLVMQDHLQKLNFIEETLTFMSRKLECLQRIMDQYGKLVKAKFEDYEVISREEKKVIIDVDAVEERYKVQMEQLREHFKEELRKRANEPIKAEPVSELSQKLQKIVRENSDLSSLLAQATSLLNIKEELIESLNEENHQLRQEVEKLKKGGPIRGSADSSLGYSAIGEKYGKKDSVELGKVIHQDAEMGEKRQFEQFQEQKSEDINYSELESVRDKSLDEWDISQLDLRQASNAKSLEEECLKIIKNDGLEDDSY